MKKKHIGKTNIQKPNKMIREGEREYYYYWQ